MDHMVNSIWLVWKLACMLSTYRTYNSTVGFLKYEFNNKLLDDVTLFGVILHATWNQPMYKILRPPLLANRMCCLFV